MKPKVSGLLATTVVAVSCLLGSTETLAQHAYITNNQSNYVSVIDTVTNMVITSTPFINGELFGVSMTPDGRKVFVANYAGNTVSVIDTATNTVIATVPVGSDPLAFGIFIQPAPRFAGTPGKANCHGQSVSALARQYGGLNNAAAAMGFDSVKALLLFLTVLKPPFVQKSIDAGVFTPSFTLT
jgi:YVTN family beta-propeller protein